MAVINGSSASDSLTGTLGDDVVDGGGGDDRIEDAGGSDVLRGGIGNDTIFISRIDNGTTETVTIEGGAGTDTVTYQNYRAGSAAIDLGDGDDRLTLWTVQSGNTRVALGSGLDTIAFGSGFDTGFRGTLTITDFASSDRFDLGVYLANALQGWDGSANPFGAAGYLRLVQSGVNTLLQIDRNGFAGGAAFTTIAVLEAMAATTLTAANFDGYPPDGSQVAGITLNGTSGVDTLIGTAGADTINGLAGNDQIEGGAGDDRIDGSDGTDRLQGGGGNDVIDGGEGNDSIEDTGGSDTLRGGIGNDTIFISRLDNGTTEAVTIEGGTGDDTVTYQSYRAGSAAIDLGDGNDRLTLWTVQIGGTRVTLGTGADTIAFGSGFDTGFRGTLTITDFADSDRFDLVAYLTSTLQGWDGSANPFGAAGYLRLAQSGANTLLQIDRNGIGGGAAFTTLGGLEGVAATTLTAANFGGFVPRVASTEEAATITIGAPTSVIEGAGSVTINLSLNSVTTASGTVTLSFAADQSTATNGVDVSVPTFTSSYNVSQSPAGAYVINLPAITIFDDALAESAEVVAVRVKVPGQRFANGTDEAVVRISLVDNDPTLPATDQFTLIAGAGVQAAVIGTGRVAGGTGVQDITVVDAAGTIGFGATFNEGGDRVRLSGNASGWTIRRSGTSAELSDGDTIVVLPVGTAGVDVIFADGIRALKINAAGTALQIGAQTIATTAAPITAAAGPATATGATDPSVAAQLVLTGAGPVIAMGNEWVAGSPGVVETVYVAAGGRIAFGPTFNAGGDTIVLPGTLASYSASRSGSTVSLVSAGETVSIAIGTVGTTFRFADGAQGLLRFDEAAGQVKLGTAVIGTTPAPIPALSAIDPGAIFGVNRGDAAGVAPVVAIDPAVMFAIA